ncbi:O-antigen ligase family protein [Thiobacillus denitrificans]|uniref:O-antigen ligase-related domain-containing protein n=1 Tax=Thiobacillus denitrificans TaxID=36861 RepID=A0A106BLH1_THIDE|nr:O-antigen ligase family protein [Thiobacillus denitrificans]KVW94659.1 hypothetical protein ABW22_11460 [Thiobacillus denitrificans]
MMQYAFITAYFMVALIIPLAFIVMLWGLFRITGQRDQRILWGGLIGVLGFIPVLTDIRTPRGEWVNGILQDVWVPPGFVQFLALWGARGLTYLILAFSLIVIIKNLQGKQIDKRHGSGLFIAYLALIAPAFISAVAGTRPSFSHFMTHAPLIFTLAYLARPSADWMWYVRQFKLVLLTYISLSALFGIVAPTWSTGTALTLIPGFDFRLHGIFSHSNSLGMAALVYLVLDMADGADRSLYRKLGWLVSVAVLVATQSKTSWAGAVLAYGVFFIYKISAMKTSKAGHSATPAIIGGLVILVGFAGAVLLGGVGVEGWFKGLNAESYSSLTSLTGRTNIWAITIHSWQDNPIFGYGPGLWDVEYRLKYAPQYLYIVGMAHNQFFQTLGESGVLGVIGLFIYVGTLITLGVRFFTVTRGVSLALVVVLIVRSVSETPFRNQALDLMFFIHLAVFVLFLSLAANAAKPEDSGVTR